MTRDDETTTVEEEPEAGAGPSAPAEEAALEEQAPAPAEDEADPVALERDRYLALAQRTQADFENFRKRSSRDVAAADSRGVTRLAKELLPALDNLGRALAATASGAASEHDLARACRDRGVLPGRRAVRSPAPRGGQPAARRGCRAGHGCRGLPARVPVW